MAATTATLASNKVNLFPSSMRTGQDPYSRFTTELNLVDIVNRVSSGKFVTGTFTEGGNTWVDFTLMGYHFNADISGFIGTNNTIVYALAIVGYMNNESRYDAILKGWSSNSIQNSVDSSNKFIGLQFVYDTSEAQITTSCNTIKSAAENSASGKFICDYMKLGIKTSSGFQINEDLSPINLEYLTNADIDAMWS